MIACKKGGSCYLRSGKTFMFSNTSHLLGPDNSTTLSC